MVKNVLLVLDLERGNDLMIKNCKTCDYHLSFPNFAKCTCGTSPKYNLYNFSNNDIIPCDYYMPKLSEINKIIQKHWEKLCKLLGEEVFVEE